MEKRSEQTKCYENYPCWVIIISNSLQIAIYFIGAFIVYQLGFIWLIMDNSVG